jgi:hypothetical protein
MKRIAFVLLLALVAPLVAAPVARAVLTRPGVEASGSGSRSFKVCSTCPDDSEFEHYTDGGSGVGVATSEGFSEIYYEWFAEGVLRGPNLLPVLKASAFALEPATLDPDFLGIGYTSATASAQGLEEFHYAGTADAIYEITFQVNGSISGDFESIEAGLAVYGSDYTGVSEGPGYVPPVASASMRKTATNGAFADSRTVSFLIAPDTDFFVTAYLSANAFFADATNEAGGADAAHSFNASFTAGDVSLLSVVPEPGFGGLVLLALGTLPLLRHR